MPKVSAIKKGELLLLLFLFLFISKGYSQQDDYFTLQCKGPIPEDFTKMSVEKFKEDVSKIETNESARSKRSKEQFYLESNYHIDALLNSGKVLFGDEVTQYVNQVADKALVADPSLRSKLRIYVIKSPVVNAFATNNGIIFISVGLIAQLENEAQLAFVICHEAIHFKEQHSLSEHQERQDMLSGRGKYRMVDKSDLFLMEQKYSKELETEADVEGFDLLAKSEYNVNSVLGLFDVLLYADLPFDDQPFSPSYFETADFIFPSEYTYSESMVIEERMEDEDDKESTHPNVRKRKTAITEKIAKLSTENTGSKYVVSKEAFVAARRTSRFEICRELLLDKEYQMAFYQAYMLQKDNPDSKYLQKTILKSLYYMAKYKNHGDYSDIDVSLSNVEGNAKSVFFLFDEMSDKEMNVVALRYAFEMNNKYPSDEEVNLMYTDLMYEFTDEYSSLDFFLKESRAQFFNVDTTATTTTPNQSAPVKEVEDEEVSKIDKIKKVNKSVTSSTKPDEINFLKFAFVDIFASGTSFTEDFAKAVKKREDDDREKTVAERERERKEAKINRRKGYALGLDKVVFASPYYEKRDTRKQVKKRYVVSEKIQIDFNNRIAKCAANANLEADILNPNTMTVEQVRELNDHGLVMEWISEKVDQDDDIYFVSPLHNEMKEFSTRHETSSLSFVGAISITAARPNPGLVLLLTIMYWPTLPFGIYYCVTPEHYTRYFTLLFDTTKEELVMGEMKSVKMGESKTATMSHMYYTFMQYHNKRAK